MQDVGQVESILRKGEEPIINEGMHIIVVNKYQNRDTKIEKEAQITDIMQKRNGQP